MPRSAQNPSVVASFELLPQLDAVGAAASFLCALHCAAMPILLSTLPLAGLEMFADHRFERIFVVLASLFGVAVIGSGYCRHRLPMVAATLVAGIATLLMGAFAMHGMGVMHALTLALGGLLLGYAHARNRRGVRHHGCARSFWRSTAYGAR